jgi:hypothetical protein
MTQPDVTPRGKEARKTSNALRHGRRSAAAIALRRLVRKTINDSKMRSEASRRGKRLWRFFVSLTKCWFAIPFTRIPARGRMVPFLMDAGPKG